LSGKKKIQTIHKRDRDSEKRYNNPSTSSHIEKKVLKYYILVSLRETREKVGRNILNSDWEVGER
jgi:hypothetical protein